MLDHRVLGAVMDCHQPVNQRSGGKLRLALVGMLNVALPATLQRLVAAQPPEGGRAQIEARDERYDPKLWIGSGDVSAAYLPG
jgi:hypothetical protein